MAKRGAPQGNENARGRIWTDAIKRAIARRYGNLPSGLDQLADDFIEAVAKGGLVEKEMMGNRLEGKPAQALVGPEGGPIELEQIKRVIVDPKRGKPSRNTHT